MTEYNLTFKKAAEAAKLGKIIEAECGCQYRIKGGFWQVGPAECNNENYYDGSLDCIKYKIIEEIN